MVLTLAPCPHLSTCPPTTLLHGAGCEDVTEKGQWQLRDRRLCHAEICQSVTVRLRKDAHRTIAPRHHGQAGTASAVAN